MRNAMLFILVALSLGWSVHWLQHRASEFNSNRADNLESERAEKKRQLRLTGTQQEKWNSLSQAERDEFTAVADKIALTRRLLTQAHNLFKQAYNAVVDRRPLGGNIPSPFQEINWKLNLLFDASGLPYDLTGKTCQGNSFATQIQGNQMLLLRCQDRRPSVQVAAFRFSKTQLTLEMDRPELRQGFGSYIALFATGPFRVLKACRFQHQGGDLLQMDCPGLGQNVDSESYVEFDIFRFKKDSKNIMSVHGFRRKDPNTIIETPSLIVPLVGDLKVKIEVSEEPKIEAKVLPEMQPLALQIPHPPPSQPQGLPPIPPVGADAGLMNNEAMLGFNMQPGGNAQIDANGNPLPMTELMPSAEIPMQMPVTGYPHQEMPALPTAVGISGQELPLPNEGESQFGNTATQFDR